MIGEQIARMYNPPHPGEILADTVVREDGGLSVTELARRSGVSRVALSRVVNGRAAVSAELAIRLSAALGGSPECWLSMQSAYDLAQVQRAEESAAQGKAAQGARSIRGVPVVKLKGKALAKYEAGRDLGAEILSAAGDMRAGKAVRKWRIKIPKNSKPRSRS